MKQKQYLCIDLKSFYASVECVERGLDPLTTNLLVADKSRTEKTICLAVTPSLKSFGISGRARLFEVVQKIRDVNQQRRKSAPYGRFTGKSYDFKDLMSNPSLSVDYIIAPPQMALYMKYSTKIYEDVYLKHIAPEDIHVYSVDEVFIDITAYLKYKNMSAHDMAMTIIKDILKTTGITATAGIGTNLYLAKVAMDITAKKMPADKDGVRIAVLDEMSYRQQLWDHRPLTDFWRIGNGYSSKLEANGMYTMGDIARCSVGKPFDRCNEGLLYKLFGVNAELLIDHAWGWEPCTISDIKDYKPSTHSLSTGQVLCEPYDYDKAKLIVEEMTDSLVLDLVEKGVVTNQIVLTIGYDVENLIHSHNSQPYKGDVVVDHYGRKIPKHGHGTVNFGKHISSTKDIMEGTLKLYERIADKSLLVRRITIAANNIISEKDAQKSISVQQLDFSMDWDVLEKKQQKEKERFEREHALQKVILKMKKKYGKNAVLKGMNYKEGATAIERNRQVGGHKA